MPRLFARTTLWPSLTCVLRSGEAWYHSTILCYNQFSFTFLNCYEWLHSHLFHIFKIVYQSGLFPWLILGFRPVSTEVISDTWGGRQVERPWPIVDCAGASLNALVVSMHAYRNELLPTENQPRAPSDSWGSEQVARYCARGLSWPARSRSESIHGIFRE